MNGNIGVYADFKMVVERMVLVGAGS